MTRSMMKSLPLALLLLVTTAAPAFAEQEPPPPYRGGESRPEPIDPSYLEAIQRTSAMIWDDHALRLPQMHGLDLINVTWEDTGRYYDSAVGPNISDMTIQVQHQDPDNRNKEEEHICPAVIPLLKESSSGDQEEKN